MSILVMVTILVAATGCSKSDKKKNAATGGSEAATTTVPPVFPLTGLPATDDNRDNVKRVALVIKVENHPEARPQAGLEAADVVFEEVVEGGQTRYLAVFHSTDADPVGPVRSVRPSDPEVIAPFHPLFGYSGGTAKFVDQVRKTAGVTDVGVDKVPDAYPRRSGKRAPHNQYTSTKALYDQAPADGRPPPALANFLAPGEAFGGAGVAPAAHVALPVGSSTKVNYDWDAASGTWKRSLDGTPHNYEGGGPLAPTNVIVQFVPYQVSPGDVDVTGAQVFKANVIGSGDAWIFSGGMVVKGKWSKPSVSSMTTFTDSSGAPIKLTPGRTWVELPNSGVVPTIT